MAQPFRSLWEKMSPDAQAAAEQKLQAMLAALALQELQQARQRPQAPADPGSQELQADEVRKE